MISAEAMWIVGTVWIGLAGVSDGALNSFLLFVGGLLMMFLPDIFGPPT